MIKRPAPALQSALVVTITLALFSRLHAQPFDVRLATERDRLLKTYSDFKKYGLPAADVYQRMDKERKAVFDGSLRAMFQAFEDSLGHRTGELVIDYVAEIRGIWGPRKNDKHGEHMFRVSVLWKPGIAKVLSASNNFGKSAFAHVLLPEPKGGDDDPQFTAFNVLGQGLDTFRQNDHPSIQISFVSNNEVTGEMDVDFDTIVSGCHTKPSNSDVSSVDGQQTHLGPFNTRFNFFQQPLQLGWSSSKHCQAVY